MTALDRARAAAERWMLTSQRQAEEEHKLRSALLSRDAEVARLRELRKYVVHPDYCDQWKSCHNDDGELQSRPCNCEVGEIESALRDGEAKP